MFDVIRTIAEPFRERRGLAAACVLFVSASGVAAAAYWWVAPRVANRLVRDRLAGVERRAGVATSYDRIEPSGLRSVAMHGFRARLDSGRGPLLEVDRLRVSLDVYHLAFGEPVVSAVAVRGAELTVRRREDGSTNLAVLRSELSEPSESEPETGGSVGSDSGLLRHFGGEWPNADLEEARLTFESAPEARGWPVERLAVDRFALDSDGARADLETRIEVRPGEAVDSRWRLPRSLELSATLRTPLSASTGKVEFDRPAEIVGIDPLPALRVGLAGLEVAEDSTVRLRDVTAALQAGGRPQPFGSADRIGISLEGWPSAPEMLRVDELVVERPRISADIDRQHGSVLHDLVQLTRSPVARAVVERAERVARLEYLSIPRWRRPEQPGGDGDTPGDAGERPSPADRLRTRLEATLRSRFVPARVEVRDAAVELTDRRRLGLQNPSRRLGLRNGKILAVHDRESGEFGLEGGFDVRGNRAASRGSVSFDFDGDSTAKTIRGTGTIDALDLSWLAQMLGTSVARRMRGGRLDARLSIEPGSEGERSNFSGAVSVSNGIFDLEAIAEEPLREVDAGYEFEGYFDADMALPEPEFVEWRHLSWDDRETSSESDAGGDSAATKARTSAERRGSGGGGEELDGPPEDALYPTTGAVVVTSGEASLNGARARFRPALFGIDGLRRRPARLDVEVELERTDVQQLFESVPEAIRGPVADARMKGTFAWNFDAEIPLYDAGEMEWETDPKLRDFRLVSLPEPVDVRELEGNFLHVIEEDELDFRRQIRIPEMRPVSATYLTEHCEISIEELDERRRRRGWPPLPPPSALGSDVSPGVRERPEIWVTESAESRTAPAPWEARTPEAPPGSESSTTNARSIGRGGEVRVESNRREGRTEGGRAGPGVDGDRESSGRERADEYVYVPLHHVSKWLPRAIMTTEDNSLFEHDGFNWFALENSVEENIAAGGFVRGASTVSMQLVKNLYLSFDKVLARKLREAYLVWLMESVVDVPKARILELYVNVIEFGPEIYGIYDASTHYFGKRPDELTLTEAVFLVSVIPNPKEHHRFYEEGDISDSWFDSLITYVEIMESRDRATKEDVERARDDRPAFYKPDPDDPQLRPPERPERGETSDRPGIDDFSTIFESPPSGENP